MSSTVTPSRLPGAAIVRALALCLILGVAGCATSPQTNLSVALDHYDAGRYDLAHEGATDLARTAPGRDRDEAAYLAGLSAYRLGRIHDAETHLAVAATSQYADIVGNARVMQGVIRLEQRRPREAAVLFADAATALEGEEARQAAARAADAYQAAGDTASARRWRSAAAAPTDDPLPPEPELVAQAPVRAAGGGRFTLQVGAFREHRRARRAADDVTSLADRAGLGPVRLVPGKDARGRPLHLVQFGRFPTRTAAASARANLGRLEFIVAATPSH